MDLIAGIANNIIASKFTPILNTYPSSIQVYSVGKLMNVDIKITPDLLNIGNYIVSITSEIDIFTAKVVVVGTSLTSRIDDYLYTHINFDNLIGGDLADISGRGKNGLLQGATFTSGKHGNGIYCDGTGKKFYIYNKYRMKSISPQIIAHQGVIVWRTSKATHLSTPTSLLNSLKH